MLPAASVAYVADALKSAEQLVMQLRSVSCISCTQVSCIRLLQLPNKN